MNITGEARKMFFDTNRWVDTLTAREQSRYLLYLYKMGMTNTWAPPNKADLLKKTLGTLTLVVRNQLAPGLYNLAGKTYISDTRLRWIKESDQRQLIFLLLYVNQYWYPPQVYVTPPNPTTFQPIFQTPPYQVISPVRQSVNFWMPETLRQIAPVPELRREAFIAALDLSSEGEEEKQKFIDGLRAYRSSVMLNQRQLSWFNPNDPTQARWALDLLHKSHPKPYFYCTSIFYPGTKEDISAEFLAKLDMIGVENPSEQELVLNKIRKAWSVYKSRKSPNAKKPVSFTLSEEALEYLDKLQKEAGRSRSEIIERLLIHAGYTSKTSV